MEQELPTSTQILIKDLKQRNNPMLNSVIQKAKQNYYHDYMSPLAMPIHQLISDLQIANEPGIAKRAVNGKYDATKEEAKAWIESEDGQAVLKELGPLGKLFKDEN